MHVGPLIPDWPNWPKHWAPALTNLAFWQNRRFTDTNVSNLPVLLTFLAKLTEHYSRVLGFLAKLVNLVKLMR